MYRSSLLLPIPGRKVLAVLAILAFMTLPLGETARASMDCPTEAPSNLGVYPYCNGLVYIYWDPVPYAEYYGVFTEILTEDGPAYQYWDVVTTPSSWVGVPSSGWYRVRVKPITFWCDDIPDTEPLYFYVEIGPWCQ